MYGILISDLAKVIYQYLNDKDFCNYLNCSKYINKQSKLKVLTSKFDLIGYYNVKDKYILTNILLTDKVINKHLGVILPITTVSVHIIMFNGIIVNANKLNKLRFIDFGIHYTNSHIINDLSFMDKDLLLSFSVNILTNNILSGKLRYDLKSIKQKQIYKTSTLVMISLCTVNKKIVGKLLKDPNLINFQQTIEIFSRCINHINKKKYIYKCYPLKEFFDVYNSPFDLISKGQLDSFCVMLDYIFDVLRRKIILIQNTLCDIFNCRNMTHYYELCNQNS